MKFEELNIIKPILKALAAQGYESPTPIQEKALPPALKGRDVLGCAQTGTGKTCAFAVPILQRLQATPKKGHPIRALVLTPTRELAIQIQECFQAYGKNLPLRSTVIFGGVGQNPQIEALQKGTDILVATPGRLQDLYNQGEIHVQQLEVLVLDEADRMLDMGFIHDVRRILEWLPARKQTLFFSATMPEELTDLVNSLLHDPVRVAVDPISSPVERIQQQLYYVDKGNKTALLADLLQQTAAPSALVFTRTKHGANKVAQDLKKRGINAEAIHGNKSQTARQAALNGFKAGTVRVLVATDIAARGLDIEDLPYVFNYNLPDVPETYIHRIGRTGRAGREGVAISFCDISEVDMLKDIEKLTHRKVPVVQGHAYPMVVLEPPVKDKKGRIINPEDQEARQAARQNRRQKQAEQAAAHTVEEPPAANEPAPTPEPPVAQGSKKAKKQKKSKAPDPQQTQAAAALQIDLPPLPAPKAQDIPEDDSLPSALRSKKERTYVRPVRQTSLDDFLKEITGDQTSDDFADLDKKLQQRQKQDRFLDATDRMFATHSSRYRDAYGGRKSTPEPEPVKPEAKKQEKALPSPAQPKADKKKSAPQTSAPAEEKPKSKAEKKPKEQPSPPAPAKQAQPQKAEKPTQPKKTRSGGKKSPRQTQTPAAQPADKKPNQQEQKSPPAAAEKSAEKKPEQTRLIQANPKKKRRSPPAPPPRERSPFATQKDSTEQKSLMKPYYIKKD